MFYGGNPPSFGKVDRIISLKPAANTSALWLAITAKKILVCGVNVKEKIAACSSIQGLHEKLKNLHEEKQVHIRDVWSEAQPRIKSAALQISTRLGMVGMPQAAKAKIIDGGVSSPDLLDDGGDPYGDGGNGGGGDLGAGGDSGGNGGDGGDGSGGDGDTPVYLPGEDSGEGGEGGNPLPGAANNEGPERSICMAGAYMAWLAEDSVCKTIRNPSTRGACNDYNWREYNTSRDICEATTP